MKKIIFALILVLSYISVSCFANELVFEPVGGGKFIYCNNPEGIVDDMILNGSTPRWIMNNHELVEDVYYIYLSHFNYTGGENRGYDIELDMAMTAKKDSEIIIHKAFFETQQNYAYYENWNKKIEETDWGQLRVCAGMLGIPMCDIRGKDFYYPGEFQPVRLQIKEAETVWLSEYLEGYSEIQFGKGVHIQALVEIVDGVMDFNVGALKSGDFAGDRAGVPQNAAFGEYRWDYTLKGIADTLPQVKAEIDYKITDETEDGESIPVFLKNQYIPDGHTVTEWYTHLNPQNDIWSKTAAAESDMLRLEYEDNGKLDFYGAAVSYENRDNIWRFDTTRSGAGKYEARFGIENNTEYEPNFLLDINKDNHAWACNLGNYGVTTTYKMNIKNQTAEEKYCSLVVTAASQVIAYATDENGKNSYAYVKDLTAEKVTDNMLSYKIPPNSSKTFEFSIILPVNYNGGIKNELIITNENIQAVDFREKEEAVRIEKEKNDYISTEVTYGEPLDEAVGNVPEIFDGAKGSYEYLKGKEMSLVRWSAWDGAPYWYFNLWDYTDEVYFLDKNNDVISSYEFSSLPCGASYTDGKFYVKTADDGLFVTLDGKKWEKEDGELPVYVPYYDLEQASNWAVPELEKGWDEGIRLKKHTQNGYNFKSSITREDFCNLAAETLEILGYVLDEEISVVFPDTANPNIQNLASLGVIKGFEDGTFRPDEMLTREMAATILVRLAETVMDEPVPHVEYLYADSDSISSWAKDSAAKAYSLGIMHGIGDNVFDPKGLYSREQSAVTMLRLYIAMSEVSA